MESVKASGPGVGINPDTLPSDVRQFIADEVSRAHTEFMDNVMSKLISRYPDLDRTTVMLTALEAFDGGAKAIKMYSDQLSTVVAVLQSMGKQDHLDEVIAQSAKAFGMRAFEPVN